MIFYKHFIGDYQRDTGHLSLMEHGAYRLLMDTYYATEKPLPSDEGRLFRLLKAIDPEEQDALRTVLGEFWERTDDGWVNARAYKEIAEWLEKAPNRTEQAKAAAAARWDRARQDAVENAAEHKSSMPDACSTDAQNMPSQSQSQNQRKDSSNEESQRKSRGTRLPQGWEPTPEDIAYAQREGFTDDEIGSIAEDFTDYWIATPGQRGRKSDWSATWRTWVRRQHKGTRGNGRYSHAAKTATHLQGLGMAAAKDQAEPPHQSGTDRPAAVVTPIRQAGAA